MRKMIRSKMLSAAVAGFMMLGALVAPVSAQLIVRDAIGDIPSVNAQGLLDFGNPGPALVKQYKFTRIGIVTNISRGLVGNLSGRPQLYRNPGLAIQDPQTGNWLVATTESLVVGPALSRTVPVAGAAYVGSARLP